MMIAYQPQAVLRPFIEMVWATSRQNLPASNPVTCERVLPTGNLELVFRLSPHPLRLFDDSDDLHGHALSCAIVGGARATFSLRDVSEPACPVGAELRPGVSQLLFGVPSDELARRHTVLGDLWGRSAESTRKCLAEAGDGA